MMWIPFGGKAGIIGGGKGGGGMLKTVRRAVRSGGAAQDSFSHSSSATTTPTNTSRDHQSASNVLSLFSSTDSTPYSPFSSPIYSNSTIPTWNFCSSPVGSEGFDWDYVDGSVYDGEIECYDDPVFGSVPSIDEVQNAVSALRQFPIFAYSLGRDVADEITSPTVPVNEVSSDGTERDWIEPSLQQLHGSRMLQPHESDRVYDAFHLLQTDPCIQRMVVSVSSDKAVWEAVLNNDVVREIRESLSKVDNSVSEKLDDTSDSSMAATNMLIWIFDKTKVKVAELIEKITKLVNELFQPLVDEEATGDTYRFEEKVRASFLLSIVVLLVVVVGRAHKA